MATAQEPDAGERRAGGVQSVERAIALLSALATSEHASLSQLASRVGLPITTTHRLLSTLRAHDWVRRLADGDFVPGPGLVSLGAAAQRAVDPLVEPALARVAERTGETANYAVLDGDMVLYLAQQQADRMMRIFTEVGARVPAHATAVGKVLLAGLEERDLLRTLEAADRTPTTPRTITDPVQLREAIDAALEDGYAVDDEERELGVRCVAVPVRNERGTAVAAVSVSGPASRVQLPPSPDVLATLRRAASHIGGTAEADGADPTERTTAEGR